MRAGAEVGRPLRAGAEVHSSVAVVDRTVDHLVGNTERTLVLATF